MFERVKRNRLTVAALFISASLLFQTGCIKIRLTVGSVL